MKMDENPTILQKFDVKLIEFDENEKVICEIRKHFFGLFVIYLTGFSIAAVVLAGFIGLSLWLENNPSDNFLSANSSWVLTLVGIVSSIVISVFTLIYAYIFGNNVMLVTTDKLAQVLYRSPFNRKVSQLNISDVQDVTVQQVGVVARLLNFGTLVIETAGEQQNYTFTYAGNPHGCAKEIMGARERSISKFGN